MAPGTLYTSELESPNWSAKKFEPVLQKQMQLIGTAIREHLMNIDEQELDSFFVCDIGELKRLVKKWRENLPRIEPFYAVKCNNDRELLRTMAVELGLGFDCASKNEIQNILSLGVNPSRIIYANPCKAIPHIRYAKEKGVDLTTVDNIDELYKMKRLHEDCGLLIRILTDDSTSACPLSVKFGASLDYAKQIVDTCSQLKLNLRGIAFHVGSGCKNFNTIKSAVADCKKMFDYAATKGFELDLLDVGGGFSKVSFQESSKILRDAIETHFPLQTYGHMQIISELGRYLSSSCFTLVTNVIGKRSDHTKERIYLNDGLYGNLNCILYDHQKVEPRILTSRGEFKFFEDYLEQPPLLSNKKYSIWGPTCDGLDCITQKCGLPYEVQTSDWLYFKDIGAYTSAASTSFNGFEATTESIYVDSEDRIYMYK
ncbi:hypothetical protein FOA43_004523 [Brettanomyces nanus]|uniref:Ornithine decarboxylase n=1 Tax=Eeniella nana TaxID=13502 RepID=A0A875SCB8_EENNA|nr:uncharacterized protein FOA43_004523 [Brettanomyces nanus]QPG77119.1 hypothetical protein FOA43_004523 [Brettanomyces nanus]